jgi:hypothetical protein
LLQGVKFAVLLETFDGGDFAMADGADGCDARAGGHAIKENGAGAALALAAAVLAAGEVEVITQDAQEAALAIGIHGAIFAVDVELGDSGHGSN